MTMRVGHGFDVHRFEPGDYLVLGGVKIPFTQRFKAHSDGDVLIHAICDALLGAACLGDIGRHFPDNDPSFSGIDSTILLRDVLQQLTTLGYQVCNIDATIVAQAPRMGAHIDRMQQNLDELIGFSGAVNVKATTTEKLGFTGRGEGIAVHAVALIHGSGDR